MNCWNEIITPLLSTILGGILALIGSFITFRHETKRQHSEEIDRVKPIIINYDRRQISDGSHTAKYIFEDETKSSKALISTFKNTDNGLLFFDYIKTENKIYYPKNNSAVDKDIPFFIQLNVSNGETFKSCALFCHDIYGTKYYYPAHFNFGTDGASKIVIDNIMPVEASKQKKK